MRGFTIVELTVALSVSAVVLLTGYELFKSLKDVGDRQSESMVEFWEATDALERIREDLLHAVAKSYGQKDVFAGGNAALNSEKSKLLEFYSFCVTDYADRIGGVRQIHRIEYELVKEKGTICLYRTAVPIIKNAEPVNKESKKPIFDKIEQIRIFFHDGRRLLPAFSSKQNLPVYVKLELTANGQTWPLAVKLPCGTAVTEQGL